IVPLPAEQDTVGQMTATVADAAALFGVLAGADQSEQGTAPAAAQPAGYTQFLDAGALAGARIGIWRDGAAQAVAAASAVLDEVISLLRSRGAEVLDPVDLADADQFAEAEKTALLHEFASDLDAYLAALGGEHPRSLAELIAYNTEHASRVLAVFGQEIFEQALETGGRPDPRWRPAREKARTQARSALDGAFAGPGLDAVLALSGNPAWLTDPVLGDSYSVGTSSLAAVAGYPAITVPAAAVSGLPVGISLIGPAWSEPRLIALAYAYEQASG
ncbi:MAG: amidase family protein, partial [Streptosporangiaceae bacterium]